MTNKNEKFVSIHQEPMSGTIDVRIATRRPDGILTAYIGAKKGIITVESIQQGEPVPIFFRMNIEFLKVFTNEIARFGILPDEAELHKTKEELLDELISYSSEEVRHNRKTIDSFIKIIANEKL